MKVFIPVYCRNPLLVGNATLVFKTLRIGFPTAHITVIDFTQIEDLSYQIEHSCKDRVDLYYRAPLIPHHQFMTDTIYENNGELVFLDSDILLWANLEDHPWTLNAHIAGRIIPDFKCEYSNAVSVKRVHTSFYRIHNAEALRAAFNVVYPETHPLNPFEPMKPFVMFKGGNAYFYDEGANFYQATRSVDKENWVQEFRGDSLSRYDHIGCGSWIDVISPKLEKGRDWRMVHQIAQTNPTALRGLWKEQDLYYHQHKV